MRYETPAAFRQALLARIRQKGDAQGVTVERLRKRVVFERMLARLIQAAPDGWALKGALALDFRLPERARATKDADLVTEADIERLTEDLLTATRVDLGDNFSFRIRRGVLLTSKQGLEIGIWQAGFRISGETAVHCACAIQAA